MIEKFTEEELRIIRRELKDMKEAEQKKRLLREEMNRVFQMFKRDGRKEYASLPYYADIEHALLMITDMTLGNVAFCCGGKYRRRGTVPEYMAEKYRAMFKELVDVIEKYHRERMAEEQAKEEQARSAGMKDALEVYMKGINK